MPPKFSLQALLDYRANIVEALEVMLGRLLQEEHQIKELMNALELRRDALMVELSEKMVGELELVTLNQIRSEITMTAKRMATLNEKLEELAGKIAEKRQQITAAKQDEEVLNTLKDKMLEEFQLEVDRQENLMMEDINIARAYQQSKSSNQVLGL